MKILIVEDNKELNEALKKGFSQNGYITDTAFNGKDGLFKAQVNEYDLIIFDLNLPKLDGLNAGKILRQEKSSVPIIALTARDKLTDKVKGFESGFDDYLTKPFEFQELLLRVSALIRRSKPNQEINLNTHSIELDTRTREITRSGKNIKLTKIEFNIFEYLLRKKGIVVTNEELIEHIWSEESDLLDPPVRSHIKNLRKKIKDENFEIIETIPGVGYKIN